MPRFSAAPGQDAKKKDAADREIGGAKSFHPGCVGPAGSVCCHSADLNIRSLFAAAAGVIFNIEAYLVALVERLDAGLLECSDVNKHILAAIIRSYETIALLCVEEFDRTTRAHFAGSPFPWVGYLDLTIGGSRSQAGVGLSDCRENKSPPGWVVYSSRRHSEGASNPIQ